jgi:NADH:ubiquinone oxidoreductase subunit F (NADH-binding)/(2Fe-2S) ferredoxin
MTMLASREELNSLREKLRAEWAPDRRRVYVCMGTGCKACGGDEVVEALRAEVTKAGLDVDVDVSITGCHGFCERGTLVMIQPEGILYTRVTPRDVPLIVDRTLGQGEVLDRLLYDLPPPFERPEKKKARSTKKGERVPLAEDIPFYKHQERVVLGLNDRLDPTRIDEYIREGGYQALARVLAEMTPDQVIEEVTRAGLRGRGGGGFPTGRKWRVCRDAPGDEKYVICNADEGDPGAFMDRSLLEGNPHSVLEGMCIGAYAIGAKLGYIYIRSEYPLAVERLKIGLAQMRERGFLGDDILGSGFSFDLRIKEGAGAFVCGEETALIASIEGLRGMPTPKPPYPAIEGHNASPTNVNNVESWGNVPLIIERGADWFASLGTETSKGTKIFSLVGNVNNTGLVEVPMGMPIRELVEKIGGGVREGRRLKAVQTGGPSGGCIPDRLLDLPVDFESLAEVGSIMGSGGLVVMDEHTCMVDIARYFLAFTQSESCGKCPPCRVGTRAMLTILERICNGHGKPDDIERLEKLCHTVISTSLCGLGQSAPNPVLTTIKYFREEYEAHIHDKRCPGKTCKALIKYRIDPEYCPGCMVCKRSCPVEAISGDKKVAHVIDHDKCTLCGNCFDVCRFDAVVID